MAKNRKETHNMYAFGGILWNQTTLRDILYVTHI